MSTRMIDRWIRIENRIRSATGAELLIRAILHGPGTRALIHAELDRRAMGCLPRSAARHAVAFVRPTARAA